MFHLHLWPKDYLVDLLGCYSTYLNAIWIDHWFKKKKCWRSISCRPLSHSSKAPSSSSSSSCCCQCVVSWLHTHDQHTLRVHKAIRVCVGFFFFLLQCCCCRYFSLGHIVSDLYPLISVLNSPVYIFIMNTSVDCWKGSLWAFIGASGTFITLYFTLWHSCCVKRC